MMSVDRSAAHGRGGQRAWSVIPVGVAQQMGLADHQHGPAGAGGGVGVVDLEGDDLVTGRGPQDAVGGPENDLPCAQGIPDGLATGNAPVVYRIRPMTQHPSSRRFSSRRHCQVSG